jgi:hypothetical protein
MGGSRMHTVALMLVLFLMALSPAHGYSMQHCLRLFQSSMDAYNAKNYSSALQASSDFEKECNGIVELDDLTFAISYQARA